jgi:hypothetical protein
VEKLAELRPEVAATGHGVPMYGEQMRQELEQLLCEWDRVAKPSYGRYVHQPAVTDQHGIVSLPPPVADPNLGVVLAGAAAAGVAWLFLSGLSRSRPGSGT